jgi:hypothetical protein
MNVTYMQWTSEHSFVLVYRDDSVSIDTIFVWIAEV